jgi:hypothetical protein
MSMWIVVTRCVQNVTPGAACHRSLESLHTVNKAYIVYREPVSHRQYSVVSTVLTQYE